MADAPLYCVQAGETAKEAGVNAGHPPLPKKGIKRLFNRRRDHFPRISSTDSLLSSTSSVQTIMPQLGDSLLSSTSSAHQTIPHS